MITVKEAELLINRYLPLNLGKQKISIETPYFGNLSEDILSDRAYPPFDRVMMDGIAINFESYQQGNRSFLIEGISPAGHPRKKLNHLNGAIEVTTGCPLPEGCDLVIPHEHLTLLEGVAQITIEQRRSPMDNVHRMGSDISEANIVLKSENFFDGPSVGIASSMGYTEILVSKKPKILIVSTGDELIRPGETPDYYQLRISNSYAIQKSLELNGFDSCEKVHLKDDVQSLTEHFNQSIGNYHIIIYSGGVSKGKFDYLPQIWEQNHVKKIFHGISQRPGKPMWFGVHKHKGTLIFGLPGNPVSSLVCLHRYILNQKPILVELQEDLESNSQFTLFKPVDIKFSEEAKICAFPVSIKNSGEFTALQSTKGFIELPSNQSKFKKGEVYPFYPWRPIL